MTGRPRWFPDEAGLSGVDADSATDVRAFAARQAFDPGPELDRLVTLGLGADDTLVELGPGPGELVLAAAEVAGAVVAVDPAPAMAAHLRAAVARRSLRNVTVVEAGVLAYDHEGPPVGYVFTKNALHQLPDFWKVEALTRVAALLRPGGVLRLRDLVWSFPPAEATARLEGWFAAADVAAGGWSRAELEAHVRDEHSTYTWLLEAMFDQTGFAIEDRAVSDSGIFAAYTCRRR